MIEVTINTMKPWLKSNVTFGLVLAVCTEVPRWTFAFKAAHEPVWAGCALAILISYAAAHAWEEYFTQHDPLLLTLNSLSLFFGVYTIAPVLYLMSASSDHSNVALSDVFGAWFIGSWAFVLSCTTFLPLIQVAVVEVRRRGRLQPQSVQVATPIAAQPAPLHDVATPAQSATSNMQPAIEDATPVQDDASGDDQPDPKEVAKHLKGEGLKNAQIAARLNVDPSTVGRWLNGANKVAA